MIFLKSSLGLLALLLYAGLTPTAFFCIVLFHLLVVGILAGVVVHVQSVRHEAREGASVRPSQAASAAVRPLTQSAERRRAS
ncbi:MAG TPA: hypothetical protein VMS17_15590 [Gemmataceae bacterium]|nr:hypothetical protein [Gemmataceae bacterium]